jgi:hypothetical protein
MKFNENDILNFRTDLNDIVCEPFDLNKNDVE